MTLLDFKNYIKTKETHKYGQLIFTKTQMQFNGERVVFSTDGVETIGHPYAKNKLANTALNIKPHAEIN